MPANGARKQALLMGTGWTPAAAAALALFKSSPGAPIYLWAPGAVALGWTGIFGHALATAQREARMYIDAAGGDTRAVIDGLAQVMSAEMRRACSELLRVDELLAHAIEQLTMAFDSVGQEARRQRSCTQGKSTCSDL